MYQSFKAKLRGTIARDVYARLLQLTKKRKTGPQHLPIHTEDLSGNLLEWERKGRPIPPPHVVKEQILITYAQQYAIRHFVETGTFRGDMVNAVKDIFDHIISVELDEQLCKQAQQKFAEYKHIQILQGDSSNVLPHILSDIKCPVLFWLDGHYSGVNTGRGMIDTPIMQELEHILNHHITKHVILIDDARLFVGQCDYPTLNEIEQYIYGRHNNMIVDVADDIIRIHPKVA